MNFFSGNKYFLILIPNMNGNQKYYLILTYITPNFKSHILCLSKILNFQNKQRFFPSKHWEYPHSTRPNPWIRSKTLKWLVAQELNALAVIKEFQRKNSRKSDMSMPARNYYRKFYSRVDRDVTNEAMPTKKLNYPRFLSPVNVSSKTKLQ